MQRVLKINLKLIWSGFIHKARSQLNDDLLQRLFRSWDNVLKPHANVTTQTNAQKIIFGQANADGLQAVADGDLFANWVRGELGRRIFIDSVSIEDEVLDCKTFLSAQMIQDSERKGAVDEKSGVLLLLPKLHDLEVHLLMELIGRSRCHKFSKSEEERRACLGD